jgi:hypothetical protein
LFLFLFSADFIMYFHASVLLLIAAFTASSQAVPVKVAARQSSGLTLQQQLELAGTAVNRLALLNASDFVYDFNASTEGIVQGQGMYIHKFPPHAASPFLEIYLSN